MAFKTPHPTPVWTDSAWSRNRPVAHRGGVLSLTDFHPAWAEVGEHSERSQPKLGEICLMTQNIVNFCIQPRCLKGTWILYLLDEVLYKHQFHPALLLKPPKALLTSSPCTPKQSRGNTESWNHNSAPALLPVITPSIGLASRTFLLSRLVHKQFELLCQSGRLTLFIKRSLSGAGGLTQSVKWLSLKHENLTPDPKRHHKSGMVSEEPQDLEFLELSG